MARINFEDDIESHDEFWALLEHCNNDREKAIGRLVLFFRLAQKAWGQQEPMSEELLKSKNFECMIQSGWAVPVENGYYSLGSEKHFDWYRQKVSAGKKGGRPKKQANIDNRSLTENNLQVNSDNQAVNPVNPLTLTLTPSLSLTPSLTKNNIKNKNTYSEQTELLDKPKPDGLCKPLAKKKPDTKPLWEAYEKFYIKRYSVKPLRNAKTNAQMVSFAKRVGFEDGPKILEFYLRHEEVKYLAAQHTLGLALQDAESLRTQWMRDLPVTRHDAIKYRMAQEASR